MLQSLLFQSEFDSLHITDFLDLESLWHLTQVSKRFRKIKHNVSTRMCTTMNMPNSYFGFPLYNGNPIVFTSSILLFSPPFVGRCALRRLCDKSILYTSKCGLEFIDVLMKPFPFMKFWICDVMFNGLEKNYSATVPINIMRVQHVGNFHLMNFQNFPFVGTIEYVDCEFTALFAKNTSTRKLTFQNCKFKFPFHIENILSENLQMLSFVDCTFESVVHFKVTNAPQLKEIVIDNCPQIIIQNITVTNKKQKLC